MITAFYHTDCLDGFTSAWIFNKEYPEALLIPSDPNPLPFASLEGDVYCLDCCFDLQTLQAVLDMQEVNSLTIVDHHITNLNFLEGFEHEKLTKILDLKKSGAGLTWEFLHNAPMPKLVSFIQELDLWNMDYPYVNEINSWISSLKRTFECWDEASERIEKEWDQVLEEATPLYEKDKEIIQKYADKSEWMLIGGHWVLAAQAPKRYVSKVALMLAKGNPFGVAWTNKKGYREYSLRSKKGGVDVEKIAKLYRGGGHENVAAFRRKYVDVFKK